ncbi:MAG: ABC transporter ATP-binding protein [Acinetobacter sp.]|nr:ABC transporter ATP-binding protein [Acinetobacter sp.]
MKLIGHLEAVKNYIFIWRRSAEHYKNQKLHFMIMFLLVVLAAVFATLFPYLMKLIIDQVEQSRASALPAVFSLEHLYLLVIAYACAWLMSELLVWLQNVFSAVLSVNFETALLHSGIENFLGLKKQQQDAIQAASLKADLQRGCAAFFEINYSLFLLLGPLVLQLLFIFIVLFKNINLWFGLFFVSAAVLIFLISFYVSRKSGIYFSQLYQGHNKIDDSVLEKLLNSYEIKIKHAGAYELQRLERQLADYAGVTKRSHLKIGLLMMAQIAFIFCFLLCFMLYTAYMSQRLQISSGDFVLISSYIIQLTTPFLMVSQSLMRVNGNIVALASYRDYFDLERDHYSEEKIQPRPFLYQFSNAELQLGKVTIRNFNYRFLPQKTYAVVGQTGRGKTTLLHYLMGICQLESGQLHYKSADISRQFARDIFKEVSFVGQHPVVFAGTLRENLVYSSAHQYEDAELLAWLRRFNLSALLDKNQIGLDDDLGDLYKKFSGGEKQRIGILRALLAQPKVLILDEPTAALDAETASRVLRLIQQQVDSVIFITHAQSCMQLADEILDLDQLVARQGEPLQPASP